MKGPIAVPVTATKYRRAPGAIAAQIDDQIVVLSPVDFTYHALDAVGASVWNLLSDPMNLDQIIEGLTASYDVTPDQCRTDVVPFLDRMMTIGALEPLA